MTTFAEARTPRTLATTRAARLTALSAGGAPVAGWSSNAPQRIAVDHDSQTIVDESIIRAALAGMIDLSALAAMSTDWCDAFATWFAETRIQAVAAVWDLDVEVAPSAAPVTLGGDVPFIVQAASGQYYEGAQEVQILLSAVSSPTPYEGVVRVRARTAGTVGNSLDQGSVAPRVTAGPAGLTITGFALVTAGRDAETNAQLIARCIAKWARLGAGWTRVAFDYLIPTNVPTVTRWRVHDDNPKGPGTVLVVVANAAGPATTGERDAVEAVLGARNVKPVGSGELFVEVADADALTINITVVGDGSNASLQTDIAAALAALGATFPLGPATLDDSLVRGVALGGAFTSIPIDIGGGMTTVIAPHLPGFAGAVSISALDLVAPHDVLLDEVLVLTINVTVT